MWGFFYDERYFMKKRSEKENPYKISIEIKNKDIIFKFIYFFS